MPGRGSKNHTHKYERLRVAGVDVWACGEVDCSHYMPKHLEETFKKGKLSICWKCGDTFLFDVERQQSAIDKHDKKAVCLKCELGISDNALMEVVGKV